MTIKTDVDEIKAILSFLQGDPDMTALFGSRIWGGNENPPPGYLPSQGPAICFKTRGGDKESNGSLLYPSVQFKIYADNDIKAKQAELVLNAVLDYKTRGLVLWAQRETLPSILKEQDTQWFFALAYYNFMIKNQEA